MENQIQEQQNTQIEKNVPMALDESTMIREQERLEKEKKRKKQKKWKIIAVGTCAVLVIGTVWYVGFGRKLAKDTTTSSVKIERTLGQTVVFAKISQINGNEITYQIAQEIAAQQNTDSNTQKASEGKMPEGFSMPEGMELPEGMQMPSGGKMPEVQTLNIRMRRTAAFVCFYVIEHIKAFRKYVFKQICRIVIGVVRVFFNEFG